MVVKIYTDGAARGNPDGPGGYGTVLHYVDSKGVLHEREYSQGYVRTTNNRMELMAAIVGLEALTRPCEVELYSDSKYLVDAMEKGWAVSWRAHGWRKADKQPALNADLWARMLELCEPHVFHYQWIKGHAGHPENERCDRLAVAQTEKHRR